MTAARLESNQRLKLLRAARLTAHPLAAAALLIALSACGPSTKLPPLPTPGPDLCLIYQSFRYSTAAAAVEALDALRRHIANEAAFNRHCHGDRSDSLGPR